jgi:hypothetical protein
MDTDRRTALMAGVLFIIATIASLVGTAIEQPVLQGTDYLKVPSTANGLSAGAIAELVAAGTSAAIAIALYPVLQRWSSGLALGSVVFRAMEAVMYTLGTVALLAITQIGRASQTLDAADGRVMRAMADVLMSVRQEAILAGVFAFTIGSLMYYFTFYRSRLIPRWLSGWGILAVILMLVACVLALFSGAPVQTYVPLIVPIALQEMVLAVWLIVRGFSEPTGAPRGVAAGSV